MEKGTQLTTQASVMFGLYAIYTGVEYFASVLSAATCENGVTQ